MKGWKWMQGLATSLGIASLLAGCTPEELIAVRDAGNPNDPSIAERPIEPLVASRMHGSNFRQKVVKTGFGANGHSQTWDGRVFIGAVPLGGGEGVFELLFVLLLHPCHDGGGRASLAELLGHEAHGAVDVVKEGFVAGAEVV